MGLIDNIKQAWNSWSNPPIKQEATKHFINQGTGIGINFRPSSVAEIIDSCNIGSVAPDPQNKLKDYRALDWAFPFIHRAINLHADFMGVPVVRTDDDRTNDILDKFNQDIKLRGEILTTHDDGKGMPSIARDLLINTLVDGFQPYHIMIDEQGVPEGVRIHDSIKFKFVKEMGSSSDDVQKLVYNNGMKQVAIPADDVWKTVKVQRSNRFAWGLPLTYNAEFFANLLLWVMNARKDTHVRVANPPSLTMLGWNPPKDDLMNQSTYEKLVSSMKDKMSDIVDEIKGSMAQMYRTGKPFDAVLSHPGEMSLETKSYGQGVRGLTEYTPEVELYLLQMALSTDMPVEFLGLKLNGAGMGGELFRVMKEISSIRKSWHQQEIGNEVAYINKLFLISQKASPRVIESLRVEWKETDFEDKKLIAETEKLEAEAFGLQLLNFEEAKRAIDMNAANDYAQEINRENWER